MNRIPVWMDCDTGTDDAVAIMLAHKLEEIDLLGISTVCGNTVQENSFWNTHRINELMGTSYPVYRGAEKPMLIPLVTAAYVHGENGLGDVEMPLPEYPDVKNESAWDALYACAKDHPHELRLVPTGPLTNIAIAVTKYPDLPGLLHSITLMGGSAGPGNITPAAEFNIYADPQAADIVFRCGAPIVMCGLDVTTQAYLSMEDLNELADSGSKAGCFVKAILMHSFKILQKYGVKGFCMHDSCPVMYLAHPELFEGEEAGVVVETRGTITFGKTVTDLYSDKQFPFRNALVLLKLDREKFNAVLKQAVMSI
ncbi:MAG: nucleoside hydrolase [Anaerolineaceae bacterium]|nr:nucleoside hydrolase [Anaerolineaceae bacterium]